MPDATRLIIRDLRVMMGIGVYAEEKGRKQPVLVNLVADVEPPADWQADSYEPVVCYHAIVTSIHDMAAGKHIGLVETFAEMIAAHVLKNPRVHAVTVRIEKTEIIPDAAAVGIEITRVRSC